MKHAKPAVAAMSVLAVLATGACSDDEPSPAPSPTVGSTASAPAADGSDAVAVLDQAFTGIEKLGGGYGRLEQRLGNTLAGTPKGVLSVTVAFTCTGGATLSLTATVESRDVASTAGEHSCDGSIIQNSVELQRPSAVGFTAGVKGQTNGSFAYAYYVEKKQLS
ncbi:hypothetical protein COUCH_05580 [Couchioplanes caeruleus]|uniref:hypothetical protein n=1 Tax=Couchioplanes caeruleus TaxID=56438 RepID=UPI0020C09D51|nr:hypothetical protein [Couchioplanes caeruleus]UQU65790.1 hypothetical protein COUCH_05580 [Couchioplanes caeruleus]